MSSHCGTIVCLLSLIASASRTTFAAAPDTLVVCPSAYRVALEPWLEYRRAQRHELEVIDSPGSAAGLAARIRQIAGQGGLRQVVLVGDAPPLGGGRTTAENGVVPTRYVGARVNTRWGGAAHIATDSGYSDLDRDGLPDVAIGRLPVDSPEQLSAIIRKIIRHEVAWTPNPSAKTISVVAGVGGFGLTIDRVIEAAARRLVSDLVPPDYSVELLNAGAARGNQQSGDLFRAQVRASLNKPGLAWIYLGHGHVNALDVVSTSQGPTAMLSANELTTSPLESPQIDQPLAVLLACSTGCFDAAGDCLAEKMVVQKGGPIAVIAATRVSMPYGNSVLGYELLRACFVERRQTIGEIFLQAQRRTASAAPGDATRQSLDQLATGLMPPPVELAEERREHVRMYHLLGDPLVRVYQQGRPQVATARKTSDDMTPGIGRR